MSDDTSQKEPKNNVISLVHTKKDEVVEEDEVQESLDWVNDFIGDVMEKIITESVSPITGITIVVTHRDGGVSHAHKCEKEGLSALLGALEMKKLRIATAFDLEKR